MHNYIDFAKSCFQERECEIIANSDSDSNHFMFKYEQGFYIFLLDEFFPFSLPSILTTKDSKEFPHFIEGTSLTFLCLGYEEDFNLYESSPKSIILEIIDKFFKLLSLSKTQQNKEFFKEFLHFWHKKTVVNHKIKLYVKPKNQAEEIYINETLEEDKNKRIAKKTLKLIYTKGIHINNLKPGTNLKGVYIPLINCFDLSPFPQNWNIKDLLNTNISSESYNFLRNYSINNEYIWIVFSIKLENNFEIMFTAKIDFKSKEKSNLLEKLKNDLKEITPYFSKRYDVNYLCQRTSGNLSGIGKNLTLIGCGSLGSYIATELCKLGIEKLKLFDSDKLMPENLFRHTLGVKSTNYNKALGLKVELENNYPEIQIDYEEDKINFKNIFNKNLEKSDLIIFAIGNTTTQLTINECLAKNKFSKPVIYTWLDSFGTGCHALFVDYSKKGCYKCLSLNENGDFSEKSKITFSKNSNDLIYGDGCGGTFTHYGNIILLKGASMIIKIVLDYFNGKSYDKNPFFSIKNYKQENIEYSERYLKNESELLETYDFIVRRCNVCGE